VRVRGAIAVALAAVCVACAAQEARPGKEGVPSKEVAHQPAEDAALMRQLEEINGRTVLIRDLSADFEQRKFTPLLKSPMVSNGSVRVKGSVVKWDTVKPEASVMRIDERELRIYYPAHKVVEVYPIGEDMRRLSSSPLPRLDNIRKQFTIARSDPTELDPGADATKVVGVVMTPTSPEIKDHVRTVKVIIDMRAAYATHMEVTDSDGERTLIVFSKVQLNAGLTDRDVALEVPAGVSVTRPLSGGGSGDRR
jgi:outer membrane lipoprotein-sorting protein